MLYFRIPLVDGPGNPPGLLGLAIEAVAGLIRREVPTLVCCRSGLSRGPAVAASALVACGATGPAEALGLIAKSRPVDVDPGLWHDLILELESQGVWSPRTGEA